MPDPQLGYGNRNDASIDHVNQMMRTQPWYQAKLASMGVDPNNVRLNDSQKQELIREAQAHGIVVDEGNNGQEIDDSGNFRAKGHKLRNTMIVAGIAAATLATMGAAGVFSGAAAPAAAGGLGGVESGVSAGLGAAAFPGAGTALTAGSGVAGLAGAGTAATEGAFDAAGNFIGASSIPGATGSFEAAAGAGGALSTADKIAQLAKTGSSIVGGVDSALNGGLDPMARGVGSANAAAQEARNRILGAQVDQGGPAADKTALSNMRTAGLMTNFAGSPASPYGSPAINLGQNTKDLAAGFQKELLARQAAGKSLTASGVPDPTPQELADEAAARAASQGKTGNSTLDALNTGTRLAQLAPGVVKGVRSIWDMFQ